MKLTFDRSSCFICKKKIKNEKIRDKSFVRIDIFTPESALVPMVSYPAIPVESDYYYRCKKKCVTKQQILPISDDSEFMMTKVIDMNNEMKRFTQYLERCTRSVCDYYSIKMKDQAQLAMRDYINNRE